ncbi:hypothetical protein Bbelb_385020 [Branchiostoma belcheri]|nr:hypothetical protein Bbelb_385020 [Branchiostoma belcheri]
MFGYGYVFGCQSASWSRCYPRSAEPVSNPLHADNLPQQITCHTLMTKEATTTTTQELFPAAWSGNERRLKKVFRPVGVGTRGFLVLKSQKEGKPNTTTSYNLETALDQSSHNLLLLADSLADNANALKSIPFLRTKQNAHVLTDQTVPVRFHASHCNPLGYRRPHATRSLTCVQVAAQGDGVGHEEHRVVSGRRAGLEGRSRRGVVWSGSVIDVRELREQTRSEKPNVCRGLTECPTATPMHVAYWPSLAHRHRRLHESAILSSLCKTVPRLYLPVVPYVSLPALNLVTVATHPKWPVDASTQAISPVVPYVSCSPLYLVTVASVHPGRSRQRTNVRLQQTARRQRSQVCLTHLEVIDPANNQPTQADMSAGLAGQAPSLTTGR